MNSKSYKIAWYSNTHPRFYITRIDRGISITIRSWYKKIEFPDDTFLSYTAYRIRFLDMNMNDDSDWLSPYLTPYRKPKKYKTNKNILLDCISPPHTKNLINMIAVGYKIQQIIREKENDE